MRRSEAPGPAHVPQTKRLQRWLEGCTHALGGEDKRHTARYACRMKPFRWGPEKNEILKATRGISYEMIVVSIESGGLLDILEHPNPAKYPSQWVLVVAVDDYACLVPFVEESDCFFLKTIIPSRKATRDYLTR